MSQQEFEKQFPNAVIVETETITVDGVGFVVAWYNNSYMKRTWLEPSDSDRITDAFA